MLSWPSAVNGASSVFEWHQGSRFRLMLAQVAGESRQGQGDLPPSLEPRKQITLVAPEHCCSLPGASCMHRMAQQACCWLGNALARLPARCPLQGAARTRCTTARVDVVHA